MERYGLAVDTSGEEFKLKALQVYLNYVIDTKIIHAKKLLEYNENSKSFLYETYPEYKFYVPTFKRFLELVNWRNYVLEGVRLALEEGLISGCEINMLDSI